MSIKRTTVKDILNYYSSINKGKCIYFSPTEKTVPEKVKNRTLDAHNIFNLDDIYLISDVHGYGKESLVLSRKGISISTNIADKRLDFIEWELIREFKSEKKDNHSYLNIILDEEFTDHGCIYSDSELFDSYDLGYIDKNILNNLINLLNEIALITNKIDTDDISGIFKRASIPKYYAEFDFDYIIKKANSLLKKNEYNKVIEIANQFYEKVDKNKGKEIYIPDMKYIEAQSQEKIDNCLKAYNCYLNFYNAMPEKYSEFNGNEITKYELKNIIYNVSRKMNENILKYEYEERKIIVTSKELPLIPTDTCLITLDTNFKDIEFIPYFEKGNTTIYIAHPLKNNVYINKNDYDNIIIEEKQQELLKLIEYLGAKKVEIIQKESTLNKSKVHAKTELGGVVGYGVVKVSGDIEMEEKIDTETNADKNFKWHREYKPNAKPHIPNNLIWYNHEPRWKDIAESRMNGGIISDGREIVLKASDYFSKQEKFKLSAELKVATTKIKGFYSSEEDIMDENEIIRYLKVNIEYYPEEVLPNRTLKPNKIDQLDNSKKLKDNFFKRIIVFIKKLFTSKNK